MWLDSSHITTTTDSFYHSGIMGQKWYKRRYQYEDGTYTEEGKARRRKGYSERSSSSDESSVESHPKDLAEVFDLKELEKELSEARIQKALGGYYYSTTNDRRKNRRYDKNRAIKNAVAVALAGGLTVGGALALRKALNRYEFNKTGSMKQSDIDSYSVWNPHNSYIYC